MFSSRFDRNCQRVLFLYIALYFYLLFSFIILNLLPEAFVWLFLHCQWINFAHHFKCFAVLLFMRFRSIRRNLNVHVLKWNIMKRVYQTEMLLLQIWRSAYVYKPLSRILLIHLVKKSGLVTIMFHHAKT